MTNPDASRNAAWLDPNHYRVGDQVIFGAFTERGPDWLPMTVRSSAVQDDAGHWRIEGAKLDRLRHVDPRRCAECAAGLAVQEATAATQADVYWSRWSPAAHALHAQIEVAYVQLGQYTFGHKTGAGTFTAASAVPGWLREVTAGHLYPPEAPALALARVWAGLDWPALVAAHTGDITVIMPSQEQAGPEVLPWDGLVTAWRVLRRSGYTPALDVTIEIEDLEAGPGLVLAPCGIAADRVVDNSTHQEVNTVLRKDYTMNWFDDCTCWDWLAA